MDDIERVPVPQSTVTPIEQAILDMSDAITRGTAKVIIEGFEFPDIDIGDVNLLDSAGNKIDPAEKGEAAAATADLLTDTQLRATAVPVSAATLPLPTGAATETTVAKLVSGIGAPQANLATDGAGAWAAVAIPGGTKWIDFLVDVKAYVVANAVATTPFGTNNGVPYMPNLNFRIPCQGALYLHIKGTGAAVHTLQWNAIS
jgi:hypothetical protein